MRPGSVVSVRPLGDRLSSSRTTAILEADQLEVVHRARRGQAIARAQRARRNHRPVHRRTHRILPKPTRAPEAGDFIHLRRDEPHALEAIVDSSALLTLCIAKSS